MKNIITRLVKKPALPLILFLGVALFAGCGSSGKAPGEVMEKMVRATYEGDCETIVNTIAQQTVDAVGGNREAWLESCRQQMSSAAEDKPKMVSFEVTEETIDGDRAKVSYNVTEEFKGEQTTTSRTYQLVMEDGEWRYTFTGQAPSVKTSTTNGQVNPGGQTQPGG